MGTYNYYKMFGCFNRKFKISETEPPPDVKAVFSRYVEKGTSIMTSAQLLRFLVQYQKEEGLCLDDAEKIMHEVHQRRHHLNLPIIRHSDSGFALEEFFYFLFQDDLNPPIRAQVHHDMTAPLQHYFIYTGHNSYLTGNQLSSDCSEIPIIKALQRGVRGIELDLWPNSAKDNIHVLHGRTLTTPVLLKNCLKSIKEHAFVNSPYPVIITLEDHLTAELQAKAAEMVTNIFGDMLYYPETGHLVVLPSPEELRHRIILSTKPPKEYENNDRETTSPGQDSSDEEFLAKDTPLDTPPGDDLYDKCDRDEVGDDDDDDSDTRSKKLGQLTAPENKRLAAMRGGKPIRGRTIALIPEVEEVDSLSLIEQDLEKDATSDETDPMRLAQKSTMRVFPKGTRVTSRKEYSSAMPKDTERRSSLGKDSSDGDAGSDFYDKCERDEVDDDDDDDDDSDTLSQKSAQIGAREYKRLIAIHAGKPKLGIKHALNPLTERVNRLSLSEQLLEKAAASHGTDLVRFTQKNILRVFPKGTRVTSSNFAPLTAWMHGAQMVAFNMQGHGKFLWLMHGMFRANGGCGYVKKPEFLLTSGPQGEVFDIKTPMPVANTLKVNVYQGDGWRLDFSHTHFDSYSPPDFYTKMYLVGVPADEVKKQTRIIEDDWAPKWDQEFEFPLSVPELGLLRIEVREHDMSEKDDFGGQTCLPVSELRPGFRAVPLYDKKGEKLRSVRLLMRFRFV